MLHLYEIVYDVDVHRNAVIYKVIQYYNILL